MAAASKVETEKKVAEKEVITAVYKVNLHCQQCARDIKKPLLITQGVHSVEADAEKSEVKIKGAIDVIKIHKLLQKLSKKKVELISPLVQVKESVTEKKEVKVEAKPAPKLSTHSMKVHLHCDTCEKDLCKELLKHKSIYSVKTDMKAQTVTVDGTMEGDKLVAYIRKKVNKNAEIIRPHPEKKEEKIEKPKVEAKSKEEKVETVERKAEKKVEVKTMEGGDKVETVERKAEKKAGVRTIEGGDKVEMVERKAEKQVVEVKTIEGRGDTPYVIQYVYAPQFFSDHVYPHAAPQFFPQFFSAVNPHAAPQFFSDENPHACFIM
ncbi:HEAVY METAL-ASSOCIATED ISOPRENYLATED PLANT PROTEIN 7 [Salix koriyanagi]|uniref:HEAVY METAL-ASSOCIATED ISOPRENYLATED PLANT PROTEIN 7 n=1 Tax=Salix koriyanagi TaxID=2511006 RepID=A0A9Q0U5R5_9ROSI|nr:HEAVY METAL-ASSOCIATED ISOPRENYLATED PLANT PROTEIN 7 [Salix koriyanagi]